MRSVPGRVYPRWSHEYRPLAVRMILVMLTTSRDIARDFAASSREWYGKLRKFGVWRGTFGVRPWTFLWSTWGGSPPPSHADT